MITRENQDPVTDYAQLMLMTDAHEHEFKGAFLLVTQGDSRDWRWYHAELFDDLDHMKRFIDGWLKSEYGIGEYMMMTCSVENSGMIVNPVDSEAN